MARFPGCGARLVLLALAVLAFNRAPHGRAAETTPNLSVWDTQTPLADSAEVTDRTGWTLVPGDLLRLEANPGKASADPGYYGRAFHFTGDAVVENRAYTAVVRPATGRVTLFAKPALASDPASLRVIDVIAVAKAGAGSVANGGRCRLVLQAADQIVLELEPAESEKSDRSVRLAFDATGIVEFRPGKELGLMRLAGRIDRVVVPGWVMDDLVYGPAIAPTATTLHLPAENALLGLLAGGQALLEMSWPPGHQQVRAVRAAGAPSFDAIEFAPEGQPFFLAAVNVPGIWHREELKLAYLEKDVALGWERPFPARWKTQLLETDTRTTFTFRDASGPVWRGVAGSYDYPVWFDGAKGMFHASKKVPPKGEALIYFLEGESTPAGLLTPSDMVKATLGRALAESLLDPSGRSLRTHHRRGGEGVRRACTCGCTEAIQAIFEAGQEVTRKKDIRGDIDDMIFFVRQHVERIGEYRTAAEELLRTLDTRGQAAPNLAGYVDPLRELIRQIPQECTVQQENMKSLAYADELAVKTMALTARNDTNNPAAFKKLLDDWRGMGGAQDYVVARCHMLTRRIFQEAGYGCAEHPEALAVAQEVRARCRRLLRNPDGYEIWANY